MSKRKEINNKDNIWPINYADESREEFIRVSLRSLIYYLVFLTVTTTVIFSKTSPATYIYTKILKDQFIDLNFTPEKMYPTVFDDIRTVDHFWKYISQVAISSMYNTEWFNLYYQAIKNITEPKILFETSLLGVARLRMFQVTNSSCPIINFFSLHIKQCFGYYSDGTSDTHHVPWEPVAIIHDFITTTKPPKKKPKHNDTNGEMKNITGFNYTNPDPTKKHFGFLFLYSNKTGGFIQNLARSKNESLFILQTLYTKKWVTRATRFVYFEFNLYNPNLNLFFICKFMFEFLPCGSIRPSYYFQPIYFSRYKDPLDFAILGLEVIFILFTVYYIIQEIRNCGYYKKIYWKSIWSYINIFIIVFSILVIILNICKIIFLWMILQDIGNYPNYYANMDFAVFWQRITNNFEAILLFIIWFKVIRFCSINNTMKVLGTTLSSCKTGIFPFIIYFLIMHTGYSLLGLILFGEQSGHFNNFGNAFMTLLMIIPGYYKYYTFEKNNKIIAPMFFLSYIFIMYFIFFLMLVVIIIDAYFNAKRKAKENKSDLEVTEFLSRLPNNLILKCCPNLTNHKHLKMSSKEIVSEIRNILKLSKFNTNEITRFFHVYGIYEGKYIDNKKVLELLQDMQTYKLQPSCTICSLNPAGFEKDLKLETFLSQQRRLDFLGVQLYQISLTLEESTDILQQQRKTKE